MRRQRLSRENLTHPDNRCRFNLILKFLKCIVPHGISNEYIKKITKYEKKLCLLVEIAWNSRAMRQR